MFHVVLVEPKIPQNTGNIIRLCANTGSQLHLIAPIAFTMDDKRLRRAGLDYHEFAAVRLHASWQAWQGYAQLAALDLQRMFALSTKGQHSVYQQTFWPNDVLVFGSEDAGLSSMIRAQFAPDHVLRLPMQRLQRSLNLANSVAVVVYEAWRQCGFQGHTIELGT